MFKKILVCLDGSRLAEAILPYAVEQGKHFESELVLFKAYSETAAISLAIPGMPGVPIEAGRVEKNLIEDEKEAEKYLQSLAAKLQAETQLTISYDTGLGVAGPAIVNYAAENAIELITLATHGRSGPGRIVLGSVADYVVRHAGVPILIIRPTVGKA
jgi:nucleotide-binding universal stress UspA family protein